MTAALTTLPDGVRSSKLVAEMLAADIASLKVAETGAIGSMSTAPAAGTLDATVGGVDRPPAWW